MIMCSVALLNQKQLPPPPPSISQSTQYQHQLRPHHLVYNIDALSIRQQKQHQHQQPSIFQLPMNTAVPLINHQQPHPLYSSAPPPFFFGQPMDATNT